MSGYELTRCDVHNRFLSIGEMERAACSECRPERFTGRCTRCGQPCPVGTQCPNHGRGPLPSRDRARVVRDRAINQAAWRNERKNPGWEERALSLVCIFAAGRSRAWLCEEFLEWALDTGGLNEPTDFRAAGRVMVEAEGRGWIVKTGTGAAVTSRMGQKILWIEAPHG